MMNLSWSVLDKLIRLVAVNSSLRLLHIFANCWKQNEVSARASSMLRHTGTTTHLFRSWRVSSCSLEVTNGGRGNYSRRFEMMDGAPE